MKQDVLDRIQQSRPPVGVELSSHGAFEARASRRASGRGPRRRRYRAGFDGFVERVESPGGHGRRFSRFRLMQRADGAISH